MKKILIASCLFLFIVSCNDKKSTEQSNETEVAKDTTKSITTQEQQNLTITNDTMQNENTEKEYKVKISTSYGDMILLLYNETPKHRDNFIKLVKEGYYNDLLFHRVMKDFMIQGGDPESKNAKPGQMLGMGGPGYTVPAEFRTNLIHKKGALAAARQGDNVNPTKASSGSQFYIVHGKKYTPAELTQLEHSYGMLLNDEQKKAYREIGGTPSLDYSYTVFGEVISGLDVIDKIAAVQTNQQTNRPVQDVKMKITIVE
jgi:peptidyl-prolyl cis-trans isomerase B (cyclophilin B)